VEETDGPKDNGQVNSLMMGGGEAACSGFLRKVTGKDMQGGPGNKRSKKVPGGCVLESQRLVIGASFTEQKELCACSSIAQREGNGGEKGKPGRNTAGGNLGGKVR